jgi:hypothetical protein
LATWYLLNEVIIGAQPAGATVKHFPGEFIDDTKISTAGIVAAGGILWPATDPIVSAAAALTNGLLKLRGQGQSPKLSDQLLASALYSLLGGPAGQALGPAVAAGTSGQIGGLVQKATLALNFNTTGMVVAATTATINVAAAGPPATAPALPANSRILAREIRVATAFTGGAISAMTLSLGITGLTTQIVNAQSVFTAVGNVAGTSGTDPQPFYSTSSQLLATVTSTGANLNALTAGALVVDTLYTVLP